MNIDHYKLFTEVDFILDEDLKKLVKGGLVDGLNLEQFKELLPEKKKEIDYAVEILKGLSTTKNYSSEARKAEILYSILQTRKKHLRLSVLKYAAGILVVIGLSASMLFYSTRKNNLAEFASSTNIVSENAELILSDGKRVEIDSKQSKIEYAVDGNSVSLNDTSKVKQAQASSDESLNQVIVPYGKRSSILLSDGTLVWLNSGSKIVYPPVFSKSTREVYLEGEAYFEVSKNKEKPFYVHTDGFRVKVLGTKFAVQAYKNEHEHTAVLLEGKVSLAKNEVLFAKEYEMIPNQKATHSGDKFEIANVSDAQNYISWIYGYLNCENEDIVSLTNRISRFYNIKIEVKASNVVSRFAGKLDLKEDPQRVLDGLSTIFKVKYKKLDNTIVIYE
ncbi:MAG: FecR family protein [Prolixibacteraceae bacterium]